MSALNDVRPITSQIESYFARTFLSVLPHSFCLLKQPFRSIWLGGKVFNLRFSRKIDCIRTTFQWFAFNFASIGALWSSVAVSISCRQTRPNHSQDVITAATGISVLGDSNKKGDTERRPNLYSAWPDKLNGWRSSNYSPKDLLCLRNSFAYQVKANWYKSPAAYFLSGGEYWQWMKYCWK